MKKQFSVSRDCVLVLTLLLVTALLSACRSTIHDVNNLSLGMTKAEVRKTLGDPDTSMSPGGGVEVLKYNLKKQRLYRLAVPITTEYLVRLVDGRVEAYGTPRDLKPFLDPRERTVNVNIKGDAKPTEPRVNINAN